VRGVTETKILHTNIIKKKAMRQRRAAVGDEEDEREQTRAGLPLSLGSGRETEMEEAAACSEFCSNFLSKTFF
jgi:hypothetical protein